MFRGRLSEHDKHLDQTRVTHAARNNQNQGDTLHKEIQSYTRKFQEEKRKLFRAQQNHRQVLKQYQNQVSDLEGLKTKKYQTQMSTLGARIKYLQINLQKGIAAYNEALSRNNMLKTEIDQLRKDKKNQSQAFKSLLQKIEELNSSIRTMEDSINMKKSKVDRNKGEILDVRDQNQKLNSKHIENVEQLKKSALFSSSIRQTMKNASNKKTTQTSDTQPIVKLRIRNLMHLNKQKIKIADMYKKSMEKIEQSFEQIKQESGIHDLQQITKTFLKQEQQNTFIYEYINKLTSELQVLRQQNQTLNSKIESQQEELNQQRNLMSGTPEEQKQRNKIEAYYAEKQKPIDKLNSFLNEIEGDLLDTLHVQKKQEKMLSYFNIQQYLAMLEHMIDQKYKNDKPNSGDVKSQFTKYSKAVPSFAIEDIRDKGEESMLQEGKFRDYASDFWDKKRLSK